MPRVGSRSHGVPVADRGPGWSYRPDDRPLSLYAAHQPGIATPRLDYLEFAAFDLRAPLRDVAVKVCAARPEGAAAARRRLSSVIGRAVTPRWRQACALRRAPGDGPTATPRDPLGFRDGTHNLRRGRDLDRHVWIARGDRTGMVGGTYLVVRRIEIDLDASSALPVAAQEDFIGRRRDSGAPLGGRREFDPAPLDAFPPASHVRLASPRTNAVPPMLRRSYSFDRGLLFVALMRDPQRQFVPVQRRLAEQDPLAAYIRHTGSAVFAVPPGARAGGFVGDRLLEQG